MKFAWIQTEKASYPLTKLCRWLGVTPSGFYAWRQRPESTHVREDRRLKVLVQASFSESKQRYGSPRIHADLIEQDHGPWTPLRAIKSFVPGITRDNSGIPGMPTRVGATTSGRPLWVAQPEPSSAAVGGCP